MRYEGYIDRDAPYPQNVTETVHENLSEFLADKPLAVAIKQLEVFLENSKHAELYIKSGYQSKLTLKGVRSETSEEVAIRMHKKSERLIDSVKRQEEKVAAAETALLDAKRLLEKDKKSLEDFTDSLTEQMK